MPEQSLGVGIIVGDDNYCQYGVQHLGHCLGNPLAYLLNSFPHFLQRKMRISIGTSVIALACMERFIFSIRNSLRMFNCSEVMGL